MFYPEHNRSEIQQKLTQLTDNDYAVVCFCAAWCRTCDGFKQQLEQVAQRYPQHIFIWVDVEEHEDLLIDEDIEDFPTLLIQNKKGTIFYGPLLPFAQHLERLLDQAAAQPRYRDPVPAFVDLIIASA
ncbi:MULTISPECIES: thioredoxin family protein [Paenalcaligenes]|uniref:Thioredoxin domain-containing protein n=1 Tax=Paenalcaligenes hermetiae TaxID=1157987 RepID=A0ABP9LXE3_9BURK|nr:thioredoxin family protein [Paenalcaligenes sp.]